MNFDFKLGYACNDDCMHCVVADKKQAKKSSYTTEEIFSIIDAIDNSVSEITITGGEPTIRDDFFNIVRYIKSKKDCSIILQTNGRRLSDINFTKDVEPFIDEFLISIHSYNSPTHDYITQRLGSWNNVISGILNLINLGKIDKIFTQTVISKINIKDLKKTFDFFNQIGIKNSLLTFPHCSGNALKNINVIQPKYSEIKDEIYYILSKYGNTVQTEAIPPCYLKPFKDQMEDEIKMADVFSNNSGVYLSKNKEEKIDDYGSMLLGYRKKHEVCKECKMYDCCSGVWEEYIDQYHDEIDLMPFK